jgi:hypothetical protein
LLLLSAAASAPAALAGTGAGAGDGDSPDQFVAATRALHEGRAGDAIASLETLADEGVVDAVASYDRGLAYAMRVRIGAEVPGDLGRAAHGFEEARDLASDADRQGLVQDATHALEVVRGEIARRRLRAGEPVEVDPGRSLSRTLAALLAESTWSILAAVFSMALAGGLAARAWGKPARVRIGGGVVAAVATPALLLAVGMTLSSRHDRLTFREAVVVTPGARPTDLRGIAVPGATPLPEGARVEVVEPRGASTRVRFGLVDVWVASSSLREIARND